VCWKGQWHKLFRSKPLTLGLSNSKTWREKLWLTSQQVAPEADSNGLKWLYCWTTFQSNASHGSSGDHCRNVGMTLHYAVAGCARPHVCYHNVTIIHAVNYCPVNIGLTSLLPYCNWSIDNWRCNWLKVASIFRPLAFCMFWTLGFHIMGQESGLRSFLLLSKAKCMQEIDVWWRGCRVIVPFL